MTQPVWLIKPAVLAAHTLTIERHGGSSGLRDEGLLDSALARPPNLYHDEGCTDLARLAAAFAAGLVQNHPFIDGNKRLGFAAATIFLKRNGMPLKADQATATAFTLSLAAGEIDEAAYAAFLADNTAPR